MSSILRTTARATTIGGAAASASDDVVANGLAVAGIATDSSTLQRSLDAAGRLGENVTSRISIRDVEQVGERISSVPGVMEGLQKVAGPLLESCGFVAKKIPVLGAVVTGATVLWEVGTNVYNGQYKVAFGAAAAGAGEIAGNIVGFGVGDAAREGVRETLIAGFGNDLKGVQKSGLRELGEVAVSYAGSSDIATYNPLREITPDLMASFSGSSLGQTAAPQSQSLSNLNLGNSNLYRFGIA